MAEWGVFYREVEIFPHDNADSLEIARAGNHQFVVRKGQYKAGDNVLVIPEQSVLSGKLRSKYESYLAGSEKSRVKSIRLRGELSMGILMSDEEISEILGMDNLMAGHNYAEELGVKKYEPPIPTSLAGEVAVISGGTFSKHDVEHLSVFRDALADEEMVVITEKIHGSQVAYTLTEDGEFFVTSKGLFHKGLKIKESEYNAYWRAAHKVGIEERLRMLQLENDGATVQAFGEIIPVQGGNWSYGLNEIDVLIFDIRANGESYSFDGSIPAYFMELWVPILYIGEIGKADLGTLCKGKESVSGQHLHIREGIVIRPLHMKFTKDGTRMFFKVLNPAYKEDAPAIS